MKTEIVKVEIPGECNVIIGMAHFIKTVEDLYEAMICSAPAIKFGVAFCEASGPCLIRAAGNDETLKKNATQNALKLGTGHAFIILIKDAYPMNVLNAVKNVHEVCSIVCATANPVEVIVAETDQGRGILGVIDGFRTKGVEAEKDRSERKEFLRKIGYKL
ncbi:MAG: adenosine-specific kinase [Candidatus Bathyarchaeota archaeon]